MRGPTYDREFLTNKIAMMRIKGKSTRFLIEFLQEKVGMGQTTAYEVLRDSQKIVTQMQEKDIEDAYADAIARLDELYEETPDRRVRLQIQQELNKLQGLYKPNKVDVTTNGKDLQINEIVVKFVDSKKDLDE
jgi:CHAD domain-containing protein